jgi:hypothetical protein
MALPSTTRMRTTRANHKTKDHKSIVLVRSLGIPYFCVPAEKLSGIGTRSPTDSSRSDTAKTSGASRTTFQLWEHHRSGILVGPLPASTSAQFRRPLAPLPPYRFSVLARRVSSAAGLRASAPPSGRAGEGDAGGRCCAPGMKSASYPAWGQSPEPVMRRRRILRPCAVPAD